jgi:outer membrane protein assembly factor BamB
MNQGLRCVAAIVATLLLAACGENASVSPQLAASHGLESAGIARGSAASNGEQDDWITLGHDFARSGFQRQAIGVRPSTVHALKLRWKRALGATNYPYAAVLAYAGNVIVTTESTLAQRSTMYDFRPADGTLLWKQTLIGWVRATPSIDTAQGRAIVSTERFAATGKPMPAYLYSIDLLDGHVAWRVAHDGLSHSSPVIADGIIYLGTSGGDPSLGCESGGVGAYRSSNGSMLWQWHVDPHPNEGGAVWGAIALDGDHLLFGTGNTCEQPIPTADGVVALSTAGKVLWNFTAHIHSEGDDDTGAGVDIAGDNAIVVNKNGNFYQLAAATGKLGWTTPLGAREGYGGFSTASTDGETIVVGAGFFPDSVAAGETCAPVRPLARGPRNILNGYYSYIKGVDAVTGAILWERKTIDPIVGEASIVDGLAFAGINDTFVALDLHDGKSLWSYPGAGVFDASAAVVPSGIYTADSNGNVYAFSLPKS